MAMLQTLTTAELEDKSIDIVITLPSGWLVQEDVEDTFKLEKRITLYFLKPSQSPSQSLSPSASASVTASLTPSPSNPCPLGKIFVNGVCVGTGIISVTATWTVEGDGDIHVQTPNNSHIYYGLKTDPTGGYLDVDDTEGTGPENIYWPIGTHPSGGTYHVCFDAFSPSIVNATYTIVIKISGKSDIVVTGTPVHHVDGSGSSDCEPSNPIFVTSFNYIGAFVF